MKQSLQFFLWYLSTSIEKKKFKKENLENIIEVKFDKKKFELQKMSYKTK